MSKRFSPLSPWQQIPVANRTVEVNTKTGFSLTAGSYVLHASSNQRGQISVTSSQTATISSVTVTRATCTFGGFRAPNTTGNFATSAPHLTLTNGTTVTGAIDGTGQAYVQYEVEETY